ncbi:potassium transporter Kup [Cupriavidus sp. KK10]|jgi:KUP system potassium uptake protein|uniref:potassium transporter Kup n=1 Tax=Cupriavidus sp. KK10 TaxID=1478019 RepID=UPI001BAC133E|nr:potassium transporter Kup [Cupriavidus sp. KK10]QUN31350.1 potassium transporter Kup [Cupriavidus sp. KK10]
MNGETPDESHLQQSRAALTLAALGVVYGDIGTSPLYAVKETFNPAHGIPLVTENILGGISAILWALMVVVSLKYVILIMRANNRGEGGIMALLALALASVKKVGRSPTPILLVGLFGAALFYGDAVLTPAMSVLSALEGIEVGTTALQPYILPASVGVLIALFLFQRHGTAAIGALFGPVTIVWFIALAAAGIHGIARYPAILGALSPLHALGFVTQHGFASFAVLGAVLLAFTGAEALYADMGHFGSAPIRLAWFGLVFPALALNYLGQGALIIVNAKAIENPFYLLFPSWALYPMVALATAATVIASQATISGAYSLTKQGIQLGYLPRMNVVHTSERAIGQIYIPTLNGILLVVVLIAVLGFGSSSNLASAYGVAVTGTMLVTTLLTFFVIRYGWRYNLLLSLFATGFFIAVDMAFVSSSLLKVAEGGWFPLVVGAVMFVVMLTWVRGRQALLERLQSTDVPLKSFLDSLFLAPPPRVPGTAVFLTPTPDVVPHALMHNLNHNRVLHERVVFLTVKMKDVPSVPVTECAAVEPLGHACYRITLRFGFMNRPDVAQALGALPAAAGLEFDIMDTSFFLSREAIVPAAGVSSGMASWRERLFATMSRNAGNAADYFNIPANRVIEIGTQIEI